jgi:2-hydroxychromene-2-carboxylate isomerase
VKRVEFYYDLVSPYSYLAHHRIGRICEEHGAELVLRPMLLGAVHKAVGLQAPVEIEPKRRYQHRDIKRWADHYGVSLKFPDPFPFRTLKTMRAAVFSRASGLLVAFTREAFALYWEEGGAPKGLEEADEDGPVAEVARRIGADSEEVLGASVVLEAKDALRAATSEAIERGVRSADLLRRRRDVLGQRPAALRRGRAGQRFKDHWHRPLIPELRNP